jgi:hypothetical protein
MFFILSKTLSYFTMPFFLICVCFILSAVIRKAVWKRRLFWTAFIMLFFFSNDFIANEAMLAWEHDATAYQDMKKQYTFGIVLTGVTLAEKEPCNACRAAIQAGHCEEAARKRRQWPVG